MNCRSSDSSHPDRQRLFQRLSAIVLRLDWKLPFPLLLPRSAQQLLEQSLAENNAIVLGLLTEEAKEEREGLH